MKYPWLDDCLLEKPGVAKDLKAEWNWIRYMIGGKMFAAVCLDSSGKPYYITLKLEPLEGDLLRQQYEDIIPGYYCNKVHWNSIKSDGAMPDELLKELLDKSYQLVLGGFSKKKQREILSSAALSCCGTDCAACGCYGSSCQGCNAHKGRVFHAPAGKACPIYACAVEEKGTGCGHCKEVPCQIWRETKDPALSEEAFAQTIQNRLQNLKKEGRLHGV